MHTGYDSSSTQLSGTKPGSPEDAQLRKMGLKEGWTIVWSSPQRRLPSPSLHLFQEQRVFIGWLGKRGCTEVAADTLGSVSQSPAVGTGLKSKKPSGVHCVPSSLS